MTSAPLPESDTFRLSDSISTDGWPGVPDDRSADEVSGSDFWQIHDLLDQLHDAVGSMLGSHASFGPRLDAIFRQLRETVDDRANSVQQIQSKFEQLSGAQADALVFSAEVIEELERTRQYLTETRNEAERTAEHARRMADTIFERTHDGVLLFEHGVCIACNDKALAHFEASRTDILGTWPNVFDRARLADNTSAASALQAAYQASIDSGTCSVEVQLPRGGGFVWAEIAWSAFLVGDSWHGMAIVRDITARKELETQLRQHRDFLDNILNAVPDQLYVKSTDHRIVLANDAFCTMHGLDRSEVIGRPADDVLAECVPCQIREVEDQLLTTGSCRSLEHVSTLPDGRQQVTSVKRSVFVDGVTGERYIVATSRDITEDRLREDRLRLLASVFNCASEGVAIISTEGVVREANPAFLSMTGLEHNTPLGKPFFSTLKLDADSGDQVLQQVAAGTPWSGKASLAWNDQAGSYWVSLSASTEAMGQSDRIIALVSDITELERTQERLRHEALYDNLTGLPNRRHFRDHLTRVLASASETKQLVTIGFLDLDDFKHVNDSAGHGAGDLLLQAVGRRIRHETGKEAFVARFGGDEFAFILAGPAEDPSQHHAILERLLVSFREPFRISHLEAIVGLSVGVTQYPADGHDGDTLMCNADIAMYAAKAAGKNHVRHFNRAMQNTVDLRHQLHAKLRHALMDGDIELAFQPKVSALTWEPIGCEALVRWQTSNGRYVSPAEFIPIAEQTGLIIMLGEMVFQLAAQHAQCWHSLGIESTIAVNVSPHQLRHPRFVERLVSMLAGADAKAEWFELEITECAMMDDIEHTISVINELEQLGFRVAVDDFGTGYSSLSYLKTFNIHTLKIDLSFVRDVAYDSQSRAIIKSIVSLGNGLGLSVIAEGVETGEQADILAELGCDVLQGYLIGRPMPASEYLTWLRDYDPAKLASTQRG